MLSSAGFFIYFIYLNFFIVVQIQLSPFSCHHFSLPHPHPPSFLPLALSMGPLHMFLEEPSPFSRYPPTPPLWFLSVCCYCNKLTVCQLGYCKFVLYFNISGRILLACLFCWLGCTYRWDHMVFTFYHLAYFAQHNTLQFHLTKKKICHVCFTIFRELFYWSIVTFGYIERNFHSPSFIVQEKFYSQVDRNNQETNS